MRVGSRVAVVSDRYARLPYILEASNLLNKVSRLCVGEQTTANQVCGACVSAKMAVRCKLVDFGSWRPTFSFRASSTADHIRDHSSSQSDIAQDMVLNMELEINLA